MTKVVYMSDDEALEIIWGDSEEYDTVVEESIIDQSRWSTFHEAVFLKKSDRTFWKGTWETGSTEYQETDLNFIMTQVYPKRVVTTIYTTEEGLEDVPNEK